MSVIPDFSTISLGGPAGGSRVGSSAAVDGAVWETPERIAVKPLYTPEDIEGLDFLKTWPGLPPFLRGPYPTMYVTKLDGSAICRFFDGRAVERLLSA